MTAPDQTRSLLRGFFLSAAGIAVIVIVVLSVRSCIRRSPPSFPTESQTLTGVLNPVPLSLDRRGTHLLTEIGGNRDLAFVESSTVNLRDYEGLTVDVTGLLEANIDPDALPVLNASGVTLVAMPVRSWEVDAFGMMLDVPDSWDMQAFDDGVRFVQTGTTISVLTITRSMLTNLPTGTPLIVDGRPASAVTGEEADLSWYVQNGRDILAIATPQQSEAGQAWNGETYARLLKSIRFAAKSSPPRSATGASAQSDTGSGTGTVEPFDQSQGKPCGGPAGILCPEGQYCAVTDMAEGIGRCKALRR